MTRSMRPRLGRRLRIGETDLASVARTPRCRLRAIPLAARASFITPLVTVPKLAPGENDLTRRSPEAPRAAGEMILIKGRIVDERGRSRAGTLLEIWNADANGRYDHPDDPARVPLDPLFAGSGRTLTDSDGKYEFLTIRPAPYLARADIDRWRPAHIHLSLIGPATRLVTQMYFPDDPLLFSDPSFQLLDEAKGRHIGRAFSSDGAEDSPGFEFDIVVAGARQSWLVADP